MVYAVAFSISILLFYFGNRSRINNKQIRFLELFGLGVLILLAAGRASSVGTDLLTYVNHEFLANRNLHGIGEFIKHHYLEIGYEFISFIISRFTDDVHWVYFANALIVCCGIYKGIKFFSKKHSISLVFSVVVFLLCFYNNTYNAVRQSMAVAILFGFSRYLVERRPIKYLFGIILSFAMHSSGLVGILLYFLYGIIYESNGKRSRRAIIFGIIMLGILAFPVICQLAMEMGILPNRFARYFTENAVDKGGPMLALSKLPILFIGLWAINRKTMSKEIKPLVFFTLVEFLLSLLKIRFGAAARLADYFGIYNIVLLPSAINALFRKQKTFIYFIVSLILILYWVYCIIIKNYGETMPYIWDWFLL